MNIGMIIGRVGGAGGVALEAEKWIDVLRAMGHKVYLLAGQFQDRKPNPETETLVPEMSFISPESFWSQKKAFFYPESDAQELMEHLDLYSKIIRDKILQWIAKRQIGLIISENASALPAHLEMGLAISLVVHETGLPAITHDHEFAWDRGDRYVSPHREINDFVEDLFPLRAPNSFHAVINTHARDTLQERFGRSSVYVPNVMDFNQSFGLPDANSRRLLEKIGFSSNDLLLIQATRIIRRKGIETAIQLVDKLHDPVIKLVITGTYSDDAGSAYFHELEQLVQDLGLDSQVRFAHSLFQEGQFSRSDAYASATACTYFTIREGFGNEFVEAVLARRPVFVNNYEPVFMPDIGSKGFRTVMIENGNLGADAAQEMSRVLHNPPLAREMAETNFLLGKKFFSYETLREKLEELIALATNP